MTDPHETYDDFAEPLFDGQDHDPPPPLPQPTSHLDASDQPQGIEYARINCVQCGYNLTGVTIGGNCPECGAQVDLSLFAAGSAPTSGKAVTSMVLGICSIPTCCCPGILLGIIGLVFGVIAMNDLKTGQFSPGSRGMAVAGLWCSVIGVALGAVYWLFHLANL